ncbi:MAG: hypothetical protein AB1305_01265 [Candidatus Hadarchaeota archaeon]
MNAERFRLVSLVGAMATAILAFCFFLSFFLLIVPSFPSYPTSPASLGMFVSSWSLPGPLMFTVVFRIQSLRVMHARAFKKKQPKDVPPWVKFWFITAVAISFFSVFYFARKFFAGEIIAESISLLGSVTLIIAWSALVITTILMYVSPNSKISHVEIDRARRLEQFLLVPASIVFLFFTAYPSIVILLPAA